MANTVIQLKFSEATATPATLNVAEPAYSNNSNKLFIGLAGNQVIAIGGKYYTDIVDAATNLNTANTLVKRDASGNFTAGTITAALSGNATSATTLQTARLIGVSGDITTNAVSFNGSADANLTVTLSATGVTAGTYGDSTNAAVIVVDSKGRITSASNVSTSSTLNIAGDSGTDAVSLLSDTLTFEGGDGITSTVTNNKASFAVDNTVIRTTDGTINNTVIGNNTSAAGTFTTLIGGKDQTNHAQITGGATTKAVEFITLGTDTNISQVFKSKGTGAIDLAAGSSGVNISNGGTVSAITRIAGGSGYTGVITATVSAPTTAGGVQATVSIGTGAITIAIAGGGTGYTVGNILNVSGGTFINSSFQQIRVDAVSGGVITGVSVANFGQYTTLPTNPVSVTGGTGSGATFNLSNFGFIGLSITNAGSGYVEQPTVSFLGDGSGAAAYATVGSGTVIRSLGSTGTHSLDFFTPAGLITGIPNLRLRDTTGDSFWTSSNQTQTALLTASGNTNAIAMILAAGTGNVTLRTGGASQFEQLRVTNTASAVNFVQVTGAATSLTPTISVQGSDASIQLAIQTKGGSSFSFYSQVNQSSRQVRIDGSQNAVNYVDLYGSVSGNAISVKANGSDTNIDLALTPKGTGKIRFGAFTTTILTPTGFIEIKDAGGTIRRLLVG